MKSCLICDDHPLVREALASTIRHCWPTATIAEARDFPAAWAASGHGVEVCIADLLMPGASPRNGIAGLRRAAPQMPILVVTGTGDSDLLLDLLDLGIAGFVPKTTSGTIIEAALRLVVAGGRYLPPQLADLAAARRAAAADGASHPAACGSHVLTSRQIDVLRLAANGLSNKQIALALKLSPATVKTHLAHIQTVLGARNRTDAANKARALRLL